jgi:type IV pilus assembly protein PilA
MRRQDGFSLIEILVVVAIIGIIAAIGIPRFVNAQRSAREAAAVSNLRAVISAESAYIGLIGGFASYGTMDELILHGYLDASFNQIRSNYSFSVALINGTSGYQLKAQPQSASLKYYYASETGLILENTIDDPPTAVPLSGS